jgi:capsular exopolysaccharide synthesis family protein
VAVWVVSPAKAAAGAPLFTAAHTIIRESATGTAEEAPPQALAAVSLYMKTGEVPKRVAERVGWTRAPALLARNVAVESDQQIGTVTVRATANGRRPAAELANAFAEETLAYLGERARAAQEQANAEIAEKLNRHLSVIADLERQSSAATADGKSPRIIDAQRDAELLQYTADLKLQQELANAPAPSAGYASLEEATPELASPKRAGLSVPASRPVRTAGAALLGLILGVLVVLVVERVDPRINVRSGAERAFKLPVMAEVPFASRRRRYDILTATDPSSSVAEAYRAVRAALLLIPSSVLGDPGQATAQRRGSRSGGSGGTTPSVASILGPVGHAGSGGPGNGNGASSGRNEPQVILVTSAAPSEGKTASVANLAASFAETGRSVLVLSCDFRRPTIHEYFGVRKAWGLTEVLSGGPGAPRLSEVAKDTNVSGVRIATNGSPMDNFGEVASAGRRVVAEARSLADIVLIDTAPLLVAHEATELIPSADTVVVLCRSGQTTKEDAGRARDLLTRLSAPVAGVILVGAPDMETGYSTYYYQAPTRHRRRWLSWLLGRNTAPEEPFEEEPAVPDPPRKRAVI